MTGLVGSFDRMLSRYAAFSRIQNPRTEIIEHLQSMMTVSFSLAIYKQPTLADYLSNYL